MHNELRAWDVVIEKFRVRSIWNYAVSGGPLTTYIDVHLTFLVRRSGLNNPN